MKRFFYLLLAPALAFAGCADDNSAPDMQLAPPRVEAVSDTAVDVKCTTTFDAGVLAGLEKGFAYGTAAQAEGEYLRMTDPKSEGHVLTCRIEGLAERTEYRIYAYVDVGSMRMKSPVASFTTGGENEKPDPEVEPAFGASAATGVTSSAATLSCTLEYTGDKELTAVYFAYKTDSSAEQRADVSVQPGTKSAQVSGLAPSTTYTFRLCAEAGGETFASAWAEFTTASQSGGGSTATKHSGWAELPTETQNKSGDYYYAYHMREDAQRIRNFSVCYSKKYGCPVWVAAPMHSSYKGSSGRNDSYKQDPALGCSQVGRRDGYTRGHMLGSSDRTVSKPTNRQVFYYSNIAPQLKNGFNEGDGVWNNLEERVNGLWCADTLYQVIGCYWENTNKTSSGTVIPTHYYKALLRTKKGNSRKWVVDCTRDELQCAAFLVKHNSSQKGKKPDASMLISIEELERMTGLTFFANVPNAPKDTFRASDWL